MPSGARKVVVGSVGALVALLVVAGALAAFAPASLSGLWPGHPAVLFPAGFAEIGVAAARGEKPSPALIDSLVEAGRQDPLSAEPLLVRGIAAGEAGQNDVARRAFEAARAREPRNPATRYFLADHYLRTGQVSAALSEFAMVGRLSPRSRQPLAEALAAYALSAGGAARIGPILDRDDSLRAATLAELAKQPTNADLVVSLGQGDRSPTAQSWQDQLVLTLLSAGSAAQAKAAWERFMRQRGVSVDRGLLRDPGFADRRQAPPFGWRFYTGSAGLAEPSSGDLRVIHYGREPVTLASQLLVLRPGRYTLSIGRVSGDMGTLRWRVRCEPSAKELLSVGLSADALDGNATRPFTVPTDCPAQWLELVGAVGESPSDAQLGRIALATAK